MSESPDSETEPTAGGQATSDEQPATDERSDSDATDDDHSGTRSATGDGSTARLGEDCLIDDGVRLTPAETGEKPIQIGDRARIRSGSVVYAGVEIGDDFTTGHDAVLRERTVIGDEVVIGTKTVIDGNTVVGDRTSLQTGVYVPTGTTIKSDVFVGPNAVMTNDPYPVRTETALLAPTLEKHASIGANATILPDVTVGEGAFVAAGAVVTDDVPPETLAVGAPATTRPLPEQLAGRNDLP